jgi:hypothetical protein
MIIKVNNYVLVPGRFVAGTKGSYGIEQIDFEFSEEWEGLAVSVSFYPPEGNPVALIYTGEPFYIPPEVMNISGTSKFVVSGYKNDKVLITAEGLIRVLETSVPTQNPALVPTPSQFAQIMTALEGKVDAVAGMGLSSNDYTDAEKTKLAGIENGAQINVQPDWAQTDSSACDYIKNKPVLDSTPTAGSERGVTSGGVYAALAGKAAADHDHSGIYAPAGHNHDSIYAPTEHNHDTRYAPASGECAGLVAGFAKNLSPARRVVTGGILLKRKSAGDEQESELASARVKSMSGMSMVQLLENGNFTDMSGWEVSGGDALAENNICSLTPDIPEKPQGAEADILLEVGQTYELDGYDIYIQRCAADDSGIVEVTELGSGEGWQLRGLALGRTTVRVFDDPFYEEELDSFIVEVVEEVSAPAGPAEISRNINFISGHRYYVTARIKSPAPTPGITLFAGNEGDEQEMDCADSGDWQRVSGIFDASETGTGRVGIRDGRRISASISYTGAVGWASVDAEVFSRRIKAFSPEASGDYTFVYNSGWYPAGGSVAVSMASFGIITAWKTGSTEASRQGSTITVRFSYPYAKEASATLTVSGLTGLSDIAVNAAEFAGTLGSSAKRGAYVFTYVSGAGWTFEDGTKVQLSDYGITGSAAGSPANGATITVSLELSGDIIMASSFAVYDLTYLGQEDFTTAELDRLIEDRYHEPGLHNATVGGIRSSGSADNPFDSELHLSQNYELCRLPNGVADLLDCENQRLCRKVASQTISGPAGGVVALAGAKSGTAYLCAEGDIGSITGNTLTLSKEVSDLAVYYERTEAEIINISEPDSYRTATGGEEELVVYDSDAGEYRPAPLGVPAVVEYTPDYARQIEADRVRLLGLLAAIGAHTSSDPAVLSAAADISAALETFIEAHASAP